MVVLVKEIPHVYTCISEADKSRYLPKLVGPSPGTRGAAKSHPKPPLLAAGSLERPLRAPGLRLRARAALTEAAPSPQGPSRGAPRHGRAVILTQGFCAN